MDSSTRDTHDIDEQVNDRDDRYNAFQEAVSQYLIRHKSVLDVLTKLQEANARVNRSVVKAVTSCGCIQVDAARQQLPSDITYWEMKQYMETHVDGSMCEQCKEVLEAELGRNLFYLAALCDLFNFDFYDVIESERKRVTALGVFNLT